MTPQGAGHGAYVKVGDMLTLVLVADPLPPAPTPHRSILDIISLCRSRVRSTSSHPVTLLVRSLAIATGIQDHPRSKEPCTIVPCTVFIMCCNTCDIAIQYCDSLNGWLTSGDLVVGHGLWVPKLTGKMAVPPRIRETRIQLTPKFYYSSRKAFYKERAVGALRAQSIVRSIHRTRLVDAAYDGRRAKREQAAGDLINCERRWTSRTSKTRLNSRGTLLTHLPRVRGAMVQN